MKLPEWICPDNALECLKKMEELFSTANDTNDTPSFVLIDTPENNLYYVRMSHSLNLIGDSLTVIQCSSPADSMSIYIELSKRLARVQENRVFSNEERQLRFLFCIFDSSEKSHLPSRASIPVSGAISMLDSISSVSMSSSTDNPNLYAFTMFDALSVTTR
jgi:hypothetical protein